MMKLPKKTLLMVGVIIVGVLLYGSAVGFAQPVDDFEPEVPTEPTMPTEPPTTPSVPIAYATFTYLAVVQGALSGGILQFEPHVAAYISPDTGRVYENQKWTLVAWPSPQPPSTSVKASIFIKVWGGPANDKVQTWQSDSKTISEFPGNLSGESGRVLFYGTGTCFYTVSLMVDSGETGDMRAVATRTGNFEVSV